MCSVLASSVLFPPSWRKVREGRRPRRRAWRDEPADPRARSSANAWNARVGPNERNEASQTQIGGPVVRLVLPIDMATRRRDRLSQSACGIDEPLDLGPTPMTQSRTPSTRVTFTADGQRTAAPGPILTNYRWSAAERGSRRSARRRGPGSNRCDLAERMACIISKIACALAVAAPARRSRRRSARRGPSERR